VNFELIVCDNCDGPDADSTAALVETIHDPRFRYIRTNGQLSMPDNWERGCAAARGEYVGILTDRSVLRRHALQVIYDEIQRTGTLLVAWYSDAYGRGTDGKQLRRRPVTFQRYRLESATILNYFLHGHPKHGTKVLPKLLNSVCHRSVLDEIRATAGRCCPPVNPDYTSGYLMLAHTDSFLLIDEALFVLCGVGNGSSFRRRGALADRFMKELGMSWKDLVDRMPAHACFSHAVVLNDFMRVKGMLPERFEGFDIDHTQYNLGCLYDYWKSARQGVDLTEDLDALVDQLNFEPEEVQQAVRSQHVYIRAVVTVPGLRAVSSDTRRPRELDADEAADVPAEEARFNSVFEAMTWDEQHPRTPLTRGTDELMPGLNGMKRWSPMKSGLKTGHLTRDS
jgi:hypothetical protein